MEKEIEVFDFVLKEQKKRNIENGMINIDQSKPFEHVILGKMEMEKRKENNKDRRIFDEQRERLLYSRDKNQDNVNRIKKITIYVAGIALIATTAFSLKKYSDYINQPVKIAVREMASDSGLYSTSDIPHVDGTMTDEELIELIKKNDLTQEQILQEMKKFSKSQDIESEFLEERLTEENPEIFRTY